jgi:hypothetical protein
VGLRDYQDEKADVIMKYTADEARVLKQVSLNRVLWDEDEILGANTTAGVLSAAISGSQHDEQQRWNAPTAAGFWKMSCGMYCTEARASSGCLFQFGAKRYIAGQGVSHQASRASNMLDTRP